MPEIVADSPEMNPLLKVVLQVGVPSAIAVYLVWILAGSLLGEARGNTILLQQHVQATESIRSIIEEEHTLHGALLDVLKQVCVNGAKTVADRNACFARSASR